MCSWSFIFRSLRLGRPGAGLPFVLILLGFTACGTDQAGSQTTFDAATFDATLWDAGASDAGTTDSGSADAGGQPDAQSDATGAADTLLVDAQIDAGASEDTTQIEQDAGPKDVFEAKPGLPVKAIVVNIHKGPWAFAAPSHGDVSLAVDKTGVVKLLGPLDGQIEKIEGKAKQPTAVGRFDGMTYLADAAGLHGILGAKLKLSPLADALPNKPISSLAVWKTATGAELWLVVGDALLRYVGGKIYTITAPKMQVTGATLSYGGDVEGGPAVWVAGPNGLHAIRVTKGKVSAWPYLVGRAVVGVHVDAKARVWAASEGELLRRDAPGAWSTHVLKDGPTAILGRPGDSAFWLTTSKALMRWDAEELHVVEQAPSVAKWRLDNAGRLTGLNAKGALLRVQTTPPPAKPKVAWKTDIKPLFEKACAQCHGAAGVNTKLHSLAMWKTNFDKIVKNVTSGAMPLPPTQPLTPGEIALILAWKKDGFKETP